MKTIRQLLCVVTALFSIFLVACETTPKIDAPKLTLEGEVLSWNEVENASTYSVFQNGSLLEKEIEGLEYIIDTSELKPGTYTYKVKAYPIDEQFSASNYSNTVELVIEEKEEPLDLKLVSKTVVADGGNFSLELNEKLPEGYTVTYTNNEQSEPGKYYISGTIKNEKGELVQNVYGILTIDIPKDEEFEQFMSELLIAIFEGDQMSVNFFFNNPENFGLEHYEAGLPEAYFGDYEESLAEIKAILTEMEAFDQAKLSAEQKDTYEIMYRYFEYISSITEEMNYMTNGYLGSYLGYQCNIPLELAEYKFRNEQDIQDWIDYCTSAEEAFKTYFKFTEKQAEMGYAMPDFVIDKVISQCEEFVAVKDDNYLVGIFNDKIDEVTFLTEEQKNTYKAAAKEAITGPLTNAYAYIQENMPSLKGKATIYGGIGMYEGGKEYYNLMLQDTLGYKDLTGDEAIEYVESKLSAVERSMSMVISKWNRLANTNPGEYYKFYTAVTEGTPFFSELSPEELLELFAEKSAAFVPDLGMEINTTVKLVPESLQNNFSPAAYFVSPLDETKNESIYLNPLYIDDKNYIFTTLAHEGYPGHLYQRVYTKGLGLNPIRSVVRNSGYTEGWATYVEIKSYDFVDNYNSEGLKLAIEYMKYNQMYNGILNARLDLAISYEGLNINQFTELLNKLLGDNSYSPETAKPFFEQLIEVPTNTMKYFYSWSKMDDMHTKAQKALGEYFDEVAFNTALLSLGSAPLDMYEEVIDEFIQDTLFLNGVEK